MSGSTRLVFVSYSHADSEIAGELADFLEDGLAAGDRVWIDRRIAAGDDFTSSIESVLDTLTDAVCVVSPSYLVSPWCGQERSNIFARAQRDVRVIPYLLPGVEIAELPSFLRSRKAVWHRPDDPTASFSEVTLSLTRPVPGAVGEAAKSWVLLPRRPPFVGRREEIAAVLDTFTHERNWVTNVVGRAGIGKTTLAKEATYCALEQGIFDDAVYVSAERADLSLGNLEVSILELLERRPVLEKHDYNQQARELLASRRILVVVDNFDTIDRDRQDICAFLYHLPQGSKALITSREIVSSLGAARVEVSAMQEEDATELLSAEWERLNPGKKMPFDPRVIYEGAGGNPHLMSLVLGELKSGGVLEHELDRLAKAKGKEFGYYEHLWREKLDRGARVVLQSLALFATPAHWSSLRAATGLSGDLLRTSINGLSDRYLIGLSDKVAEANRTWQLHPEIRYFALKKLRSAPRRRSQLLRRFVGHFLGITQQDRSRRSWSDYSALKEEQENIFAAMEYLTELQDWENLREITMRVRHFVLRQERVSLVPPNRMNEYFVQARYVCEKGLTAAIQPPRNVEDECRLLLELGTIEIMRQDLETAKIHLERCVERCREAGNTKREIMALRRLGHIEARQGQSEEARKLYGASLRAAEKIEDRIGIGRVQRAFGDLAFREGQLDEAEAYYRKGLEGIDSDVDWVGAPRVARRIGNILYYNGRLGEAAARFGQVIELYLQKPDLSGACYSLYALGRIQEDRAYGGERACSEDGLRCSLACLRALDFVHRELWRAATRKLEQNDSRSTPVQADGLDTYVPRVDTIVDKCFQSIARLRRFLGEGESSQKMRSIVRELSAWEGEWYDLIRDVVGQCEIQQAAADDARGPEAR